MDKLGTDLHEPSEMLSSPHSHMGSLLTLFGVKELDTASRGMLRPAIGKDENGPPSKYLQFPLPKHGYSVMVALIRSRLTQITLNVAMWPVLSKQIASFP